MVRKVDISEIRQRVTEEIENAEWLQRVAHPRGETLVGAVPLLTLIETELAAQVRRLRSAISSCDGRPKR
jgi:hypothetical protein